MKRRTDILTRMLSDTAMHKMTVHMDNGVYRHLQFSTPGTNCYRYDLVTWPGYLSVTGDMGTWTFSRLHDMFEFFGGELGINTGYWAEKLEAGAGGRGSREICMEYDHDAFCSGLKAWMNGYLGVDEDTDLEPDEDWDDEDDVLDSDEARIREIVLALTRGEFSHEHEAYQALYDADWPARVCAWDILEGINCMEYTHHFRWVLYAITKGIGTYQRKPLVENAMATFLSVRGATK